MSDSVIFLDRLHFAFNIIFHYLFSQLTMGLAVIILIFKTFALRTGKEKYNDAARFWAHIFGINFVFGVHGANYLAIKTEDNIQKRARHVSKLGLVLVTIFTLILPIALYLARPAMLDNYKQFSLGLILPLFALAALIASFNYRRKNADLKTFIASAFLIVFLMLSATFTMYPNILIATTVPGNSLTIYNSATSEYALGMGVKWFAVGFSLALFYTFHMYRSFREKTRLPKDAQGY